MLIFLLADFAKGRYNMGLFRKIFPSLNDRRLKKIKKIVDKIEAMGDTFKAMSDEELQGCTQKYIDRFNAGESLDSLLPEAFATVREASDRVLGMRHFPVQLMGGIVLYQGRIAQMSTGEGKTLVATLAAYLKAIEKKGVHIVTVNDYLVRRDAEWMGKVYKFLGLTVGVNYSGISFEEKVKAYNCDITYTTNSELGFDYLRDNRVRDKKQRVQRGFDFAIIDEVDSVLIDEARTPLIISGRAERSTDFYTKADEFVKTLIAPPSKAVIEENEEDDGEDEEEQTEEEVLTKKQKKIIAKFEKKSQGGLRVAAEGEEYDFEIGEKGRTVYLNENGEKKLEAYYGITDPDDYENQNIFHYVNNALRANCIMKEGVDYIVNDKKEIIIIDEFTGRQMNGRRFSDGLHQAIEAKEKVPIRSEDKTIATITYQNFFRLYKRLSGMTGTAKTEEEEFETIYGLDIVVIPTNKPVLRIDEPDRIYKRKAVKYNAVVKEIEERHKTGQPVLIGTVSVEQSEMLSKMLNKIKIKHNVLNAKNHEKEAEIIAQAGKLGAVTIATNMAGRGTDILLGGNPEFLAKQVLEKAGYSHELIEQATMHVQTDDEEILAVKEEYKKRYDEFAKVTAEEKQKVIEAGGLRIVGTERNEARRIDNQLRGRSGRQGDPGSSVFFMSFEDDMMRRYGGERLSGMINNILSFPDDEPLVSKLVTNFFERTQAKVEDYNFSIRKNVLGYDDVMNTQRTIIYEQRNLIIDDMDVHQQVLAMTRSVIERICKLYVDTKQDYSLWEYGDFNKELENKVLREDTNLVSKEFVQNLDDNSFDGLVDAITQVAAQQYEEKVKATDELFIENSEQYRFGMFEKDCMLSVVDSKWVDHMDAMARLKEGIGLVAYAQRDPVVQYKIEGFEMFEEMVEAIQDETVRRLFKTEFKKAPVKKEKHVETFTNMDVKTTTVVKAQKKPGPNEKCYCGSGKKYKYCCMEKDRLNGEN